MAAHPMSESLPTIVRALEDGVLAPLPLQLISRSLAFADPDSPADIRRCAMALIQRVRDYFKAIRYEGPDYSFGGSLNPYPAARHAATGYQMNSGPGADQEALYTGAGGMCVLSALHVAAYEIGQQVPESKDCIRSGLLAAMSALNNSYLSGVNWKQSCRRLGNKGVIKVLMQLASSLPTAWVGVRSGMPTVLHVAGHLATYPADMKWSPPQDQPSTLAQARA